MGILEPHAANVGTLDGADSPVPQREAVVLRHLEGRPLADIAERMGRTQAAVVGLLQRGLKGLRGALADGA